MREYSNLRNVKVRDCGGVRNINGGHQVGCETNIYTKDIPAVKRRNDQQT
jgi:hypothetical protein